MKEEQDKNVDFSVAEETMMERGRYTANGYVFDVRPVMLEEMDEYIADVSTAPIIPASKEDIDELKNNDEKAAQWAIALFSEALNDVPKKKRNIFTKAFEFLAHKNDYRYYSDVPKMTGILKWIERKVTYNGKKVRFYDLERKYKLSKAEIQRLFIFFHEISVF